ncbi:MAG: ATP-binding protein [gamma proteobacterium endosymbiont of Lamellibrachia anaximandri]|nr:ATP-binding protein [gamma proteobacterium endosymbiont of Lamellibrachia anaximandri]MBL3619559.1 ATP-binding protein [gamma proteobacterium endosymbiont of Lamellibrachia anaximandri]
MDIQLADVTIHVDKNVGAEERSGIEGVLRDIDGVVSVHNPVEAAHLFLVEYSPEKTSSHDLLNAVTGKYGHGELVGL